MFPESYQVAPAISRFIAPCSYPDKGIPTPPVNKGARVEYQTPDCLSRFFRCINYNILYFYLYFYFYSVIMSRTQSQIIP